MTPWEMASLDPRGMVGRVNVEDHQTLLHTKSVSSGPHGFREEARLLTEVLEDCVVLLGEDPNALVGVAARER